MATTLSLRCPAKINLALSVGPPDATHGGLHQIASWMTALRFADELELTRLDDGDSEFTIAFEPVDNADGGTAVADWPLVDDLSFRAHHALQAHVGRSLAVHVSLRKRIPAGAGLGGGSSNAGAMLCGLNKLFNLALPIDTLRDIGATLGSDVPFFVDVEHTPAAMVSGFGDVIEPLPLHETHHVVLALGPWSCPTGPVYGAFDELNPHPNAPDAARIRKLADQSPVPQDGPFNDLAEAAGRVEPALAQLLEQLRTELQLPARVTGSGAGIFILSPNRNTAAATARRIHTELNVRAVVTRTL